MSFQAVIFSLGSEEYGFPIEAVQEITRLAEVHPIPKAPAYIKGLITIRGQAIPLIDMHERFGIKSATEPEYAIITDMNGSLVGFAVEEVREVKTIDHSSPTPELLNSPYIGGIVNLPDRIIIQIYPEKILQEKEILDLSSLIDA